MVQTISTRTLALLAILCVTSVLLVLNTRTTEALPAYATATGQACSACHVNPAGGGTLTTMGQQFAAVPNHASDPAAAWASLTAPPAPAPAPVPAPAPSAPSAAPSTATSGAWTSGPLTVMFSGARMDGTVVYTAMLRNTGNTDIMNVYLAVSIPNGASLSGNPSTPEGGALASSSGGGVAWIVNALPASGTVGPFVFSVSAGSAVDLSTNLFVHWLSPNEGTLTTPAVMPITNDVRMAIEQQIINRFNTVDRTTELWNIQPGLGTVMIEYNNRFDNLWFAAQAGNWDMVRYQIAEMTEIQEVGEITRPARAGPLKAFEQSYLDPLDEVAQTKNLAAFVQAYDNAIGGCNNCHAASTGLPPSRDIPGKFIKIMRPTAPVFPNVDWKGQ